MSPGDALHRLEGFIPTPLLGDRMRARLIATALITTACSMGSEPSEVQAPDEADAAPSPARPGGLGKAKADQKIWDWST